MKIKEGVYLCGCGNKINQKVTRSEGGGRKGVGVDMVKCLKCGNLVSQKTKIERKLKLERGHRV